MKKLSLALVLASLAMPAFGGINKNGGGNSGGNGGVLAGSRAGMVSEAIEHSLRQMSLVDAPQSKNEVTSVEAKFNSDTQVDVRILLRSGAFDYRCSSFDHLSHGGTVLKKEFLCVRQ